MNINRHVRMPELVLRQAQIAAAALDMNVNEYVVAATSAANATLAQNSPLIAAYAERRRIHNIQIQKKKKAYLA